MFPIFQRYNFESNSQQCSMYSESLKGCFRYFKDTILKAIHNFLASGWSVLLMFPIFQRYNLKTIQNYKHKFIFTSLDVSCHIKAT